MNLSAKVQWTTGLHILFQKILSKWSTLIPIREALLKIEPTVETFGAYSS